MSTETFLGKPVHPAASILPLMDETEFNELVRDVRQVGRNVLPITLIDDAILDGRNRARAIEQLQAEGVEIEARFEQWTPTGDESPTEFVQRRNLSRRSLTADQRLACLAQMLPLIEQERAQRQQETRIKPGEKRNPCGRRGKRELVDSNSTPPVPSDKRLRNQNKAKRSTAGQLAEKAGTSIHKAKQILAVAKQHGPDAMKRIATKEVTLSDLLPTSPRGEKNLQNYNEKGAITASVEKRYRKLIDEYAVTEHKCVRKTLADIVRRDIEKFDRPVERTASPTQDDAVAVLPQDTDRSQQSECELSLGISSNIGGGLQA
jgi:hypothetical protein